MYGTTHRAAAHRGGFGWQGALAANPAANRRRARLNTTRHRVGCACWVQILVAEPFGFSEDGRMNITVSDFMLWSPGEVKKNGPYDRCGPSE